VKIRLIMGYTGAVLTLAIAVLIPFRLMGIFRDAVIATGVTTDAYYIGGTVARTIPKGAYSIQVHEVIHRRAWQRGKNYIQLAWTPASALPAQVNDDVDVDNDGKADLRVKFAVPADPKAFLTVDVDALQPGFEAMHGVTRGTLSCLIARVGDRILVRVPVKK